MPMIGPPIDEMDERIAALFPLLVAALPTRVVSRSFVADYAGHTDADLKKGVVMMLSRGEKGYSNGLRMEGKEGKHTILLVGRLKLDKVSGADIEGADVEDAELALIKEIRAFVRSQPHQQIGLKLISVNQSSQLDNPRGWVVVTIEAGPPASNMS